MTGNSQEIIGWLWNQERNKIFEIKEYKQHRTLTQNSYLWKLINEIAKITERKYNVSCV